MDSFNINDALKLFLDNHCDGWQIDPTNKDDVRRFDELVKVYENLVNDESFQLLDKIFGISLFTIDDIHKIQEELHHAYEESLKVPAQPSDEIKNQEMKKQIFNLADEYVNTMIKPYLDDSFDLAKINEIKDALYQFACWIYKK